MFTSQLDFSSLLSPQAINRRKKAEAQAKKKSDKRTKESTAIADLLRRRANALEEKIQAKMNPAIAAQRQTARRASIVHSMAQDGRALRVIQMQLFALADLHEQQKAPPLLKKIRYKSQIETIMFFSSWPSQRWNQDAIKRLVKLGLDENNFEKAREALRRLGNQEPENPLPLQIAELERSLLGRKIPGFFPTPEEVCQQLIEFAEIGRYDTILEPSAGKGDLAEAIRDNVPDNPIDVIEPVESLRQILELKGFNLIGYYFLECDGKYDRIIQNPPFEKGADMAHVQHAYLRLNPGGRLVSVMSPSPFFAKTKKAKKFQEWFRAVDGYKEELPGNSFKASGTGVNAVIVVIDKAY